MIKNCFTTETEIFEIESKKAIQYNEAEKNKLEMMAQQISIETGIPEIDIFSSEFNCRVGNWHKINGAYYYFKTINDLSTLFNELLGEVISNYFELDTVNYKIAKLIISNEEPRYGIISKNFCNKEFTYKSLGDYIHETCELHFFAPDLSILDKVRLICGSNEEFKLLQDDLKKMFVRHFYNAQCDANSYNIMLKKSSKGIRLAPLYDYSFAYIDYDTLHRYLWDIGELNVENPETINRFRNDLRFQELFYKLIDANVAMFIEQIEELHKITAPLEIKNHYKRYEKRIKELVLENKLIK